jgi:hypothetical protein
MSGDAKSLIVLEWNANTYQVALHVQGLFTVEVKEILVNKLKSLYPHDFEHAKISMNHITLYSDEAKHEEILDDEMPLGKKFYARLIIPSDEFLRSTKMFLVNLFRTMFLLVV